MQSEAQRATTERARQVALRVINDQADLRAHLLLAAVDYGASRENIGRLFGLTPNALNNAIFRARKRQEANENGSGDQT
jgi:DNA-directed RNA polymerase specialized sigma24 family protein